MKPQSLENQSIDIINGEMPIQAVSNPTSEKSKITTTPKGILTALFAFIVWGFFPLYFKQLKQYDATEIIAHRMIWTCLGVLLIMLVTRNWQWLKVIQQQPRWLFYTIISGALIMFNWLTYVWAVNHDHILEASLGYFIGPLMGVLLSLIILKEKLRPLQWIAVGLAVIGVIVQLVAIGKLPWVSLILAASFSIYGLSHRYNPIDSVASMFIETVIFVPIFFIWFRFNEVASSHLDFWLSPQILMLAIAGPITLIPLLMYNKATKMVAFNLLSFMNYLTPSLIFLLAVFYYYEPFNVYTLVTFGFIWAGLAFFSYDLIHQRKKVNDI